MDKKPKLIDINDYEKFGGGYTADSYYHKTDKSVVLKLYAPFINPEESLNELNYSEHIANLGIACPKPVCYVTTGKQFGALFERVPSKMSFARYISNHLDEAEKIGVLFAKEGKKLHAVECDTNYFPSYPDKILKILDELTVFPEYVVKGAKKLIANTPKQTTCIHGDFHIGNILMSNNKTYFIDFTDFSYGNPLYDLGIFYFVSHCIPDELSLRLFHLTHEYMEKTWNAFAKEYFNKPIEEINKLVKPYSGLTAILFANKSKRFSPDLQQAAKEAFGE